MPVVRINYRLTEALLRDPEVPAWVKHTVGTLLPKVGPIELGGWCEEIANAIGTDIAESVAPAMGATEPASPPMSGGPVGDA